MPLKYRIEQCASTGQKITLYASFIGPNGEDIGGPERFAFAGQTPEIEVHKTLCSRAAELWKGWVLQPFAVLKNATMVDASDPNVIVVQK